MIYSLPQDIEELLSQSMECFDLDTGEMIEEEKYNQIIKQIEDLQNRKEDMIDWILQKRQNSLARKTMLATEIERLEDQIKKELKTIDKMDALFTHFIPTLAKTTVFGMFQASYTKGTSTIIDDESLIPEQYKLIEIIPASESIKFPKKEMKEAIESGEFIP